MRSLLGMVALATGLTASLVAAGCWTWIARGRGTPAVARVARRAVAVACAAAVAACIVMVWALVVDDFSVRYVADNGARAVPLLYKVASLWAALEGSLLLWLAVLTAVTAAVMRGTMRAAALRPWAMATLSVVCVAFFALAAFAGTAFQQVTPVPADGPGPNPLLQDHPLMAVHPPVWQNCGFYDQPIADGNAVHSLEHGAVWILYADDPRRRGQATDPPAHRR